MDIATIVTDCWKWAIVHYNGLSIILTASATVVIAYYAWRSHQISEAIIKLTQKRDDDEKEFKQQIKDLYQAIVVSNIVLGPDGVNPRESSIQAFKRLYKGNTKIFD